MTIGGGGGAHNHSSQSQGGKSLASHLPPGTEINFMGTGQPGANSDDFLEENGQNVSRITYANLFAAIGTTWGVGDGATTFGLPDARRRSAVGRGGAGTGTLGNVVGNTGGEETHVETAAQSGLPSHQHQQLANANQAAYTNDGGSTNPVIAFAGNTNDSGNPNLTGSAGGGSGSAQNVYQPVYICGKWIKT